jgi:hypothetical protein
MTENNTLGDQSEQKDLDGKEMYTVVDPGRLYRGKGYGDWISDWFNWFLSADADKRYLGPVVFLRSLGLPNRITNANIPDIPGQVTGPDTLPSSLNPDPNYSKIYVNDPNIRIGGDRLQIFADQAVLVPIIIAYELALVPSRDWGTMQDFTGLTIDYGDNPPDVSQLTINDNNIVLPAGLNMEDFRFITPIFTAVVPDTEYGRSVKDFLEIRVVPGSYPAIVEGYFVMLKFTEPGTYWIHSWASAPREVSGPYFSELLYEIEVREKREPHGRVTSTRPSRNERLFTRIYKDLIEERQRAGPTINKQASDRVRNFENYLRPQHLY